MAQRSSRSIPGPLRRYLDAQTSPVAADPMEFWVSQDGGPRDLASFQPAHARAGHAKQPATTGPRYCGSTRGRRSQDTRRSPWRAIRGAVRSEENTSELQSIMGISYALVCLNKQKSTK